MRTLLPRFTAIILSVTLFFLSGCNPVEKMAVSTSRAGNSIYFRPRAELMTSDISFQTYITGPHGLGEYRRVNEEQTPGRYISIYWSKDGTLLYFILSAGKHTAYAWDFEQKKTLENQASQNRLRQCGGLGEKLMEDGNLLVDLRASSTEEVKNFEKAVSLGWAM